MRYRRRAANLTHPMTLAGGARLEDIFAMVQRGETATLGLVLKADVHGSLEALTDALRKLDQAHDEVRLSFVHRAVGGITESDINLAAVVERHGHRVQRAPGPPGPCARRVRAGRMRLYEVIYEVLDDVNKALLGMLKPEYEEVVTGDAEVREVFGVPRIGKVAGCYVLNGVITRGSKVRFLREGTIIWKGAIASLRRFKDDVREVREGFECGIGLENYHGPEGGRRHRDLRGARDRASLTVARACTVAVRFDLHVPASRSLKAKRAAIRPVVDGLRHRFKVSVAEVDYQDQWQRASIGVALVDSSARHLQEVMASVERFVAAAPDLDLLDIETAWLEP